MFKSNIFKRRSFIHFSWGIKRKVSSELSQISRVSYANKKMHALLCKRASKGNSIIKCRFRFFICFLFSLTTFLVFMLKIYLLCQSDKNNCTSKYCSMFTSFHMGLNIFLRSNFSIHMNETSQKFPLHVFLMSILEASLK